MTTDLTVFNFQGREVRTVILNGEPWWVARDVCTILGLSDPSTSLARLDDEDKGTHTMRTLGGDQAMVVINESGVYSLILRSRRPEAKVFKRWVTADVIPSIRKTGSYGVAKASPLDALAITVNQLAMILGQATQETRLLVETTREEVASVADRVQTLETVATAEAITAKVVSEVEHREAIREARDRDVRAMRHHVKVLVDHLVAIKVERLGTKRGPEYSFIWRLIWASGPAASFDEFRSVEMLQRAIAVVERHLIAFQVTPPARPEPSEAMIQDRLIATLDTPCHMNGGN